MSSTPTAVQITLKADTMRSDMVRGLVWFVNYAALDPSSVRAEDLDLHGAGMLPEDVEKFAHRWLAFSRSVDIEHDGVGRPVHTVESFFNSPEVGASAWPLNSHAVRFDVSASKEAHDGLRSGRLNSVSLDAYTFNKIVKLPTASSKSSTARPPAGDPAATMRSFSTADWAAELANDGWDGITGVVEAAPGLFIAERSSGRPPVGIHVDGHVIETAAASGPWTRLAAAVVSSPSLLRSPAPVTCPSNGGRLIGDLVPR